MEIGRSSVPDLAYDETSARALRKRSSNEVIFGKFVYSGRQAKWAKGDYEIEGRIES